MTLDKFKCELCSKSFATKFSRDRHTLSGVCKRTFTASTSCPHCFKSFASNSSKCRHVSNNVCGWQDAHPVRASQNPRQCGRCSRVFSSNNAKCRHMRSNICIEGPQPPPEGPPPPPPPEGPPPPPEGPAPPPPPDDPPMKHFCEGCQTSFKQFRYLKKHRQICKEVSCLACSNCRRVFKTRQSKNNHTRNLVCREDKYIRNFGEEDFSHILNAPDYNHRITQLMTMGKYAIPELLSQMYLDKRYPKNVTLRKIRRNDRYVEIRVQGVWMRRLMMDVIHVILKRMEDIHRAYFHQTLQALCGMKRDTNYRRMVYPLRVYAHIMLWYGWRCEEIAHLTMLNYPEDDAEQQRRWKDISGICMEKIYELTKQLTSKIK